MKKIRFVYEKDGRKWEWHKVGEERTYYRTDFDGSGVEEVYPPYSDGTRTLAGFNQFSVAGLSDAYAKRKIRKFMKDRFVFDDEDE